MAKVRVMPFTKARLCETVDQDPFLHAIDQGPSLHTIHQCPSLRAANQGPSLCAVKHVPFLRAVNQNSWSALPCSQPRPLVSLSSFAGFSFFGNKGARIKHGGKKTTYSTMG